MTSILSPSRRDVWHANGKQSVRALWYLHPAVQELVLLVWALRVVQVLALHLPAGFLLAFVPKIPIDPPSLVQLGLQARQLGVRQQQPSVHV